MINNGILELNSSFGGFIDVNGIDAVIKTAGNFSNSISSKEASTFTKFLDKLPEAATTFTITTKTIGLLTQNQSDSCLKKELNKDLYYFSIDKTDTFAWLENKISVACSSDINSLGKNTLKAQISLSLSPNENYFDLNTIEWRIVSQKSSRPNLCPVKDQTVSGNGNKTATFTIINADTSFPVLGFKDYATWTYKIEATIKLKENHGSFKFTSNTLELTFNSK